MAPDTALDRIQRILQLIPLAARDEGIGYDELADRLGIDRNDLERHLAELTDRTYYLDAGAVEDLQILLDDDRVRIWTAGPLRRPVRLAPGEAAALDLGLRILAAEREEPELVERMRGLMERVAWTVPDDVLDRFAADGDPDSGDALRALIVDAARRRRRVRLLYLKPDAEEPEERSVDPYTVAYAEGRWYVVGHCPERDDVRVFRMDRVLEATPGDATFDPPADFDPADWITDGRVYSAGQEIEVVVRYSGRVAPWLLERGEGEVQEDGGVVVRHRVSDIGWIVRHVLKYGRDARVVEPEVVRRAVVEAVGRVRE
jgi:predicted DNA-binding transcriptional regulator YafY